MASAVETDLSQLDLLFSLHRRMGAAIETREIAREIRERVREELDYVREAKIARLYGLMLADRPFVRVPRVHEELVDAASSDPAMARGREADRIRGAPQAARDAIAVGLFDAWWRPFLRYGIIHGDPHLGNYAVVARGGRQADRRGGQPVRLRLRAHLSAALRRGRGRALPRAAAQDEKRLAEAYAMWGFTGLSRGAMEAMTLWARFICGPILDDRVRTAADGVSPSEYGRKEIGQVMRALKSEGGGLVIPREFVFLERATIGLGGAFLRLGAKLNFHRMYEDAIADFDEAAIGRRQAEGLKAVGLERQAL